MLKTVHQKVKIGIFLLVVGFFLTGANISWSLDQGFETSQKGSAPPLVEKRTPEEENQNGGKNADPTSPAAVRVGVIKGRILDYETQKPLGGVSIAVQGADLRAQSDADGTYTLPGIPVGYYVLAFKLEGYYTDTRTDVIVRPNRITFLKVRLLAVRMIKEEVRVTADYFPSTPNKPGSRMQFNAEELRRDAGSAGDLSRALYDVPGIVKADEISNDLIVRGGSPVENGFYVDNIFVPNINHFPQWGASGGNISMLNMDFIERLEIYTGGFDASYGNRLASITDIGYREGNRERINGQANLSILGYGAQVEGPFPNRKGSWMFSANKSYLDLLRDAIDVSGFPSYYDIQGKIIYDINAWNRVSLLTINGHSQTKEDPYEEVINNESSYGLEKFNVSTVGLNWRHLWGGKGYSDTSLSYSFMKGREDAWRISDNVSLEFFDYHNSWITLRNVNRLQLASSHQLKFGAEAQHVNFWAQDFSDEEEKKFIGTFGAAFFTYVVYPFDNFSISSGLRLDYYPFSERFHISPRLSFSWVLTKRLSIHGAFGMFYQQLPLFLLKQHPDNINLKDLQARHLVLGFKYLLRHDTQLTLEAYDKQYDHFPMSSLNPYFFVIDDVNGDDAQFENWGRLRDEGKAYARGVEFTIQKKLAKNLYGLINLTYYRARYRDLMGVWRNRLYDNRYIICLSGGYKPNKYWEFNVRWIWSGNKAFTPVNEEKSREYGFPWVDYDDIMAGHLSDYQNLSLRVDRRFYFKKANLVIFAGALNILNRENELYRYWVSSLNGYVSEYMWGLVPYVGFEFEF